MSQKPSYVEECIKDYKYIFRSDLLKGKVAFITGGGTGICFTIAEVFMRHQCDTVICSRKIDKLKESAETLSRATGRKCIPVQMDVRKPETIIKAADMALSEFGRIDYLINGAAGNFLSPISGLSFNAFKTVMEIDAHGTFYVSKVIYEKYMKNHGGVIVNITATLQLRGQVLQVHAGSAKAAIETMTKHMAVEWGMDGVRVMCVAPGPIENTEGMRRLGGESIDDSYLKGIPVQRLGTREDIGNTVLYVVSDAAQLVTGTTIIADGGDWLSSSNSYHQMQQLMKKKSMM